jgi:hypothetical protein
LVQHNPKVGNGSEGFKQDIAVYSLSAFRFSYNHRTYMIAEDILVIAFMNTTVTQTDEHLVAPAANKSIVMRKLIFSELKME